MTTDYSGFRPSCPNVAAVSRPYLRTSSHSRTPIPRFSDALPDAPTPTPRLRGALPDAPAP
ncbi:MAG: hypothetical protein KDI79_09465, partial [Anaerolineae bacterium]|nr:hypothetical protein [Anaerolineae bacterium]